MKTLISLLFFFLLPKMGFTQDINFELITYNTLNFTSSKEEIIREFGQPIQIYQTNYDCGYLSSHDQDEKFYTLDYETAKFTGNKKNGFVLEEVDLENPLQYPLMYNNIPLNRNTTKKQLINIFGNDMKTHFEYKINGGILILSINSEDGIVLEMKAGKLIRIKYWSPC